MLQSMEAKSVSLTSGLVKYEHKKTKNTISVRNNYSLIIFPSVCLIILSENFCSFVMVHIFIVYDVPFFRTNAKHLTFMYSSTRQVFS